LLFVGWQPGDLGVLRGVVEGFSEEARTRSFASLTLVRYAFISCDYTLCRSDTSRVNSGRYVNWSRSKRRSATDRFGLRFQPVDATHSLNFSAGE